MQSRESKLSGGGLRSPANRTDSSRSGIADSKQIEEVIVGGRSAGWVNADDVPREIGSSCETLRWQAGVSPQHE
jgi:hypothetical protein